MPFDFKENKKLDIFEPLSKHVKANKKIKKFLKI